MKLLSTDRAMTIREIAGSALVLIVAILLGAFVWHQRNVGADSEQENLRSCMPYMLTPWLALAYRMSTVHR